MSQDQDIFYDVERDIIAPYRSPGLVAVNPEYGPQESPAPLVLVDDSTSDASDVEDTDAVRRREKSLARKGRANRTVANEVLILSLDPNERILASQARQEPLDSRSPSEETEGDDEDDEDGDDDNGTQGGRRQRRRLGAVIRNGANQPLIQPLPVPRRAMVVDLDDDDEDFPMIDCPATVAEEQPARPPPRPAQALQRPEGQTQAPHTVPKQADLSRKQFNTVPPPRTRPLFPNLRLNLAPNIRDADQDDDSILKSPIGKYAISPRDAHPDFTLPAMQHMSPPRSSPAGLPEYRMTLPSLKIAIGDLPDPSLGGFACQSPSMGRPLSGQMASYASPASYSAYSAMSPPDPPSHSNWRATTGNSTASTYSDYTSSTSVSVGTPASSIITPSPAASGPSSLTALPEHDPEELEDDSRTQHVPTHEVDLTSQAEVRFLPQPPPEARPIPRTQPAARSKPQFQRPGRPKPPPKPAARSKPQPPPRPPPEPESQPQHHTQADAESQAESETESELSELTELESELGSEPEPEPEPEPAPQSKLQPKRPSVSQSKSPSGLAPNPPAGHRYPLGPFKCTYEGCNAAPFQTQYLLNSHMNVHSNMRTHFCPVKDCPRGYGGLGFKRKNEMIRHGLVHTSPGYICPFCPDQQHRYPRPDNLQRHVRQHHSDEDRHDPRLREVLNQRTDGNNKAGKRRMRLF